MKGNFINAEKSKSKFNIQPTDEETNEKWREELLRDRQAKFIEDYDGTPIELDLRPCPLDDAELSNSQQEDDDAMFAELFDDL